VSKKRKKTGFQEGGLQKEEKERLCKEKKNRGKRERKDEKERNVSNS